MKRFLCLISVFCAAAAACASENLTAKAWDKVQLYDVVELNKVKDLKINQVVGIRFRNRSEKLRHLKPNWYEAALWQPDSSASHGYASIPVVIAKDEIAAFKQLPVDFRSRIPLVIYGRVLRDVASHFTFVQLYGTNATLDAGGNATIDWSAPPAVTGPSAVHRPRR